MPNKSGNLTTFGVSHDSLNSEKSHLAETQITFDFRIKQSAFASRFYFWSQGKLSQATLPTCQVSKLEANL